MTRNPPVSSENRTARNRYPGTHPFSDSIEDCARFFGRSEESEQLYLRVLSVPLLVQFGKSGLGKTSLLQAGLFPRLRQKTFLPVMVRLNDPRETLTVAVARSIKQACEAEGLELPQGQVDTLWELLSTTTVWRNDLLLAPVLVFDQFEEVFTLQDATFRAGLAADLGALAGGNSPERPQAHRSSGPEQLRGQPNVKIVISLREDYLGALEEFSAAIPSLFQERLRLEPFSENAARQAIIEPARLVAQSGEEPYGSLCFEFEPATLGRMIDYLKGSFGIIEPFQLQLLCCHAEAVARRKASTAGGSLTLTAADFTGSQDFTSVLKNFYRDTMLKLPGSQRRKAEQLCEEGLLDASGHRLMLADGQIRGGFGIKAETLSILSQERLLRREHRLESVFYEISHDRLAESILKSRRLRLPKKVRRALWRVAIVAPLVIALGLYWIVSIQEARYLAEGGRRAAERAQRAAENTLSFLLGEEFLGEVRDTGRSKMLEQVRTQAQIYESAANQGAAKNRGLALRNAGDLERTRGSLATSVTLFEQALKVLESDSDSLDSRRETARTRERLGEALTDQGQVRQALTHYEAAVKAWRQVAIDPSDPLATESCTSLAEALVSAGELKNRLGEATLALTDVGDALKIASAVLFSRQTPVEGCKPVAIKAEPYLDAKALEVLSHAIFVRGYILSSKEDYDGSAALAVEARRLRPSSASARKNALATEAWRANGRISETPQIALADYRKVLAEFDELRRWDPNNRIWQRERAAIQLLVSEAILACNERKSKNRNPIPSREDAAAANLAAIAALKELAGKDLTNASLQSDLVWALQTRARVLAVLNLQDERLKALEEAEQIYSGIMSDDKNTDGAKTLGYLLLDKANALAALGRQDEATKILQSSVDIFIGLIAAHQDNPIYIWALSEVRRREAEIRRKTDDITAADAADREVLRLTEQYDVAIGATNKETDGLRDLGTTHVNEGDKLFDIGHYDEALREFEQAETSARAYMLLRPANSTRYIRLANIYNRIANVYKETRNVDARGAALIARMRATQMAALLQSKDPHPVSIALHDAQRELAIFLNDNNRSEEALAMVEEEVVRAGALAHAPQKNPKGMGFAQWRLGNAKAGLGMVRRKLNKHGWEEAILSGLINIQKAAKIEPTRIKYLKEAGYWRKYVADQNRALWEEFADERFKEKAAVQKSLALEAYQEVARVAPDDEEAKKAIRDLTERATR